MAVLGLFCVYTGVCKLFSVEISQIWAVGLKLFPETPCFSEFSDLEFTIEVAKFR